jgi:hypothetical protein
MLTPTSAASEMTSPPKVYVCRECQIEWTTDATGYLREVE